MRTCAPEPGQLVGEHEPALEDVLGDHGGAVRDGVERHHQRLQVGGQARVGQRHGVDRRRSPLHHDPEPVVEPVARPPRPSPACPARSRGARAARGARSRRPGSSRRRTPRCRPRSGPARSRGWSATAGRLPRWSSVEVPIPSILAPICCSIWHRSTISGSRAALSITVVPSASTAAISTFSVAPTLGKSSQTVAPVEPLRRAGDDVAVLVLELGAELGQPGDVEVERPAADRVAARHRHLGPAAAGDQRPQDADRGPDPADQVVVGLVPELGRHVDHHGGGLRVVVHRAAEPAQQLAHDLDVQDVAARWSAWCAPRRAARRPSP